MYQPITLTKDNKAKSVPVGFSFTTFLFSFFPSLFRGDFIAVLVILAMIFIPFAALLFPCVPAMYNRIYIARLLKDGWRMTDIDAQQYASLGLDNTAIFPPQGNELKHIIIQWVIVVLLFGMFACAGVSVMGVE